jgi:hypothetical protein
MTPDEIKVLKRIYGTTPDEEVAETLGRSISEIRRFATQLALGKDKKKFPVKTMPRWTALESAALRDLYPTTPNEEIARQISRTVKSVVAKAHNLRLKKDPSRLKEMGLQNVRLRRDRQ